MSNRKMKGTDSVELMKNAWNIVPSGLERPSSNDMPILDEQEQLELLSELQSNKFSWLGFYERRRTQRYELNKNEELPTSLVMLCDRLCARHNLRCGAVTVLECPRPKRTPTGEFASNHKVTTYECRHRQCQHFNDGSLCPYCFVALVPLVHAVTQHLHKPARRSNSCWELASPQHCCDFSLPAGSVSVLRGEALWDWRNILYAADPTSDTCFIVKLSNIASDNGDADDREERNEYSFGYVPSTVEVKSRTGPLLPLADLLTIIITTSPIKSNPSTELLERVMGTFLLAGYDFALKCRKIIVCDGFRRRDGMNDGVVTKKHANDKQAMRNGIVNDEQAEKYAQYKQALRRLCDNAAADSPFCNAHLEELDLRQGYGFALRHALHAVTTPFVCVVQHDRTFMRPTPMTETVHAMWRHPHMKYVGVSMRSNLMYRDIVTGKYGPEYAQEMLRLVQRPPELLVSAAQYGRGSESVTYMLKEHQQLQPNLLALQESYQSSLQGISESQYRTQHLPAAGQHQLSLTPTLFWYDNVHVCDTAHYRDFIFNPYYKMVARGGFVEDKCSPVLLKTLDRLGLADGHSRFGCYLLDDHSGMFFTGHLDGGAYNARDGQNKLHHAKD